MKPVCIVDLDGTLLIGNSMKRFMRWLPNALWRKRRYGSAVQSLWWITLRALRVVSHRRMKWHLGDIATRTMTDDDWRRFAESLIPSLNSDVLAHIDQLREDGAAVCIASAAMAGYVEPLSDILGFLPPLATPHTQRLAQYIETRGDKKLSDINSLLATCHFQLCRFLTDHHDDLPTALAFPSQTILVSPTPKSAAIFAASSITSTL